MMGGKLLSCSRRAECSRLRSPFCLARSVSLHRTLSERTSASMRIFIMRCAQGAGAYGSFKNQVELLFPGLYAQSLSPAACAASAPNGCAGEPQKLSHSAPSALSPTAFSSLSRYLSEGTTAGEVSAPSKLRVLGCSAQSPCNAARTKGVARFTRPCSCFKRVRLGLLAAAIRSNLPHISRRLPQANENRAKKQTEL